MQLQLALDYTNLNEALQMAEKTKDHIDILEAGTPLIKAVGLESVRQLKERFPDKIIDADMKTADVGDMEIGMAVEAGAKIVHVLGITPLETIQEAVTEAKKTPGVKIAVDICGIKELIGLEGLKARIAQIEQIGADYLEVHTSISQQRGGMSPFADVKEIAEFTNMAISVAGGITSQSVSNLTGIKNLEIVIVGGGITRASDSLEEARKIKEIIDSL